MLLLLDYRVIDVLYATLQMKLTLLVMLLTADVCMHSPQGDEIPIGMCSMANAAVCVIPLYGCMIANNGPGDC